MTTKKDFLVASRTGNYEIITSLLDKVDVETKNEALVIASNRNDINMVKLLLDNGANIDFALIRFIYDNNIELVKLAIERGVNINNENFLYKAVRNNNPKLVKLLLDNGAIIDSRSLLWASENGYIDIVKLLLDNGADSSTYLSALDSAIGEQHIEIAKLLIERGVNINEALKLAKNYNNIEMINFIENILEKNIKRYDPNKYIKNIKSRLFDKERLKECNKYKNDIDKLSKCYYEGYNQKCNNPPFLYDVDSYEEAKIGQVLVINEGGINYCFTLDEILNLQSKKNPFTNTPISNEIIEEARKRKDLMNEYIFQIEKEEEIDIKTLEYSKLWNTLVENHVYPISQQDYNNFTDEQVERVFDLVNSNSMTMVSSSGINTSNDKHLGLVIFLNKLLNESRDKNTDSLLITQTFDEINN